MCNTVLLWIDTILMDKYSRYTCTCIQSTHVHVLWHQGPLASNEQTNKQLKEGSSQLFTCV